jgi:hypothetical protein
MDESCHALVFVSAVARPALRRVFYLIQAVSIPKKPLASAWRVALWRERLRAVARPEGFR